ncbi:MAG: hypothetical protein ACYS9X_20615 [Planctomycetota bacterium]
MAEHKIVLASLTAGSEGAVGAALSQVLGVPGDFGQQIAQSAPIVIISGLEPEQAEGVKDAMAPVQEAGGNLAISAASSESMGELNWPAAPTVGGRGLETYKPGYVPPPEPPKEIPPPARPATPPPAASTPAPSGTALQCPHCGGVIRVQFTVDSPRAASGPLGVGAGLADVPDVQGQPVPARPPTGAAPRSGPMDLEDFEKGVGGGGAPAQPTGDDLLKQLDAALPAKDPGLRALELAPPPAEAPMAQSPAKRARQKPGTPRPGRQGRQGQGQGRRRRR